MLGAAGDVPARRRAVPASPFGPWPGPARRKFGALVCVGVDPRKAIGYVRGIVRQYGAGALLHDLQCRLLNQLGYFEVLKGMTVRVQDVRDPGLFDAQGYQARFVGVDELQRLARDDANEMPIEFLHLALARRDRCYALFDGTQLAAYGWYTNRAAPLDAHYTLHFDTGWTYMYKGYTLPAWRGKRLHAVGMCRALRALTDEGRRGLISCVASNNFASLHSVTRMGYRIFGAAWLLRLAGHAVSYATPGCRAYGFRVEPRGTAQAPVNATA